MREEIERQIDNAPGQRGRSAPTDRFEMTWEEGERPPEVGVRSASPVLFDFGGWGRSTFTTFDTQLGRDRTLRDYDLRIWGEAEIARWHTVYGRLRTFYADYNSGDAPGQRDNDWQMLRVDQAYYRGNLGRAFDAPANTDMALTAGRQFVFLGKGMVLANVLDGARVEARQGDFSTQLIGARTVRYTTDFDPTVPEDRRESDRYFLGGTVSTTMFEGRRVYALGLAEIDDNNYRANGRNWDYNAYYLGLGADGGIPLGGSLGDNFLSYSSEFVYQFGRSAPSTGIGRERISAFGWMMDFIVLPGDRLPFRSRGVLSYYFGSGDGDRGSQLGTTGGNAPGTTDYAFNTFGYVNTGYVLAPRLTNLHVVRANFEGVALENLCWAEQLKLGVAAYGFFKHRKGATMSDFTSDGDRHDVGYELDLYADWRVLSDLDVGLRYGVFLPGGAFEKKDARQFLSAFVNFSF